MVFLGKFKLILLGSLASIILSIIMYSTAVADGYSTPHRFQGGDIISADMMNELFEYIESTKKYITISDILGTWQCTKYIAGNSYPNMTAYYTTADQDGLWHYLNIDVVFANDGDGTYSWSSNGYNAFTYGASTLDDCDGSGKVSLFKGKFAITQTECRKGSTKTEVYEIKSISDSRIEIINTGSSGINAPLGLICDKTSIPPTAPTGLSATISGYKVSLSWVDSSNGETGFKIIRRDTLEGDYNHIGTADANETSHTDTVPAPGDYWYRLKATNAHGDSLGSIVVKVTIEQ